MRSTHILQIQEPEDEREYVSHQRFNPQGLRFCILKICRIKHVVRTKCKAGALHAYLVVLTRSSPI